MKQQINESDYKQIAFKLQSDIDNKKWEYSTLCKKDIKFLKEMKAHAKKAFDQKDITSKEMLFTMIEDWIDELKKLEL
jgi:hypothetical protein